MSFIIGPMQMVILSLILKRARVKVLVKDKRAAFDAFGTYVEVRTQQDRHAYPVNLVNAL